MQLGDAVAADVPERVGWGPGDVPGAYGDGEADGDSPEGLVLAGVGDGLGLL